MFAYTGNKIKSIIKNEDLIIINIYKNKLNDDEYLTNYDPMGKYFKESIYNNNNKNYRIVIKPVGDCCSTSRFKYGKLYRKTDYNCRNLYRNKYIKNITCKQLEDLGYYSDDEYLGPEPVKYYEVCLNLYDDNNVKSKYKILMINSSNGWYSGFIAVYFNDNNFNRIAKK